jgi:hypothetical protein
VTRRARETGRSQRRAGVVVDGAHDAGERANRARFIAALPNDEPGKPGKPVPKQSSIAIAVAPWAIARCAAMAVRVCR